MYIIDQMKIAWSFHAVCVASLLAGGGAASGQASMPPTMPLQLPPSASMSSAGAVSIQQTTLPVGPNTINTNVQVMGALQGSVPDVNAPSGTIALTLAEAVRRGLQANLAVISASNSNAAARSERLQMLSALLPNISANASENLNQVNLAAYGFSFKVPASLGFSIPSVVGPYSYVQIQAAVSQSILDPVAIQNWKTSKELESGARLAGKDARELIVLAVASSYLQAVAAGARIESQRAQVANAEAVYNQAEVRKTAGTNARIDVMRTLVELQSQKQRLNSLEADWRKQKIALSHAIGLPLDRAITLTEPLISGKTEIPQTGAAITQAFESRQDLQAGSAQIRAAEHALSAARAARWPSIGLNGDYGVSGPNPGTTHGVFALSGSINIPIWSGGRTGAQISQAEAALRQRKAEFADQRGRVEQEVRNSLIDLETASGQLELAQSNRSYAAETLQEARDRFDLGVATSVEVVQAQEQVASAENDYVSSLLSFDLARLSLARAVGRAEASLPDLLKGERQ